MTAIVHLPETSVVSATKATSVASAGATIRKAGAKPIVARIESLGYGEYSGSLGGFGNQTVGVSEHDHYRSWRDREMAKLDKDYADYCREREQQFNQDFDSWRSNRSSRSPSAVSNASSNDLGSASNAGVGTTTASMTGSAGAGSSAGSATGTGGSIQSDTTTSSSDSTSSSGRSRSRT